MPPVSPSALFRAPFVALAVAAVALPRPLPGAAPLADLRPLAQKFCYECHDKTSAEAELDLETLLAPADPAIPDHRTVEKLLEAVAAREMPPRKADAQPSDAERAQIVAHLRAHLGRLQTEQRDDPGHVVVPRLTRTQYRHAIRDLTDGLVATGGELLPSEGGAGEGFANVGEAQGMDVAQFEKYLEAAKGALRHLRATPARGLVWHALPADPVDDPAAARADAAYAIIQWYFREQQRWGAEHRDDLQARLGFNHAAYLEAAWRYRWRAETAAPTADFAAVARGYEVPLGPVSLAKWWGILNDPAPDSPFAPWAKAWRELPAPAAVDPAELRRRCIAIVAGAGASALDDSGDYAPPYEVSFHETKEEVLSAAYGGRWPFRIALGDAKELFLVVTDAGDGGNEFALWRQGRFVFRDGTARPWQDVTGLVGANSGRAFPWGLDGANAARLAPDSVGMRAPGTLKFAVPEGAVTFEVEAAIDQQLNKVASIQVLVLKEKPASQSFVPGRKVFGGRARTVVDPSARANRDRDRFLRLRNVAEANQTKLGLNAERNVLENWIHTPLEFIGGPWPDHTADKAEPRAPYHFTAVELRANVTPEALRELAVLEADLASLVQRPHQELAALARAQGMENAREGVMPGAAAMTRWPAEAQTRAAALLRAIEADESAMEARLAPALRAFARRAWRRAVNDAELAALLDLYRRARGEGASFDSAVKAPLLVVLTSPHFLYLGTPSAAAGATAMGKKTVPLSGPELATRLSFFLWASLPDDELIRLGESGALRDPAVLRDQARRLLRDPRAAALATDFGAQVWGFADFARFTNPDAKRFPEFTPALRQAMLDEVTLFLADLFQHDRPLTALLDADYTFADAVLAKHYGAPVPAGPGFTRVALPADQRGGLATMGLFLTKTSLPLRTSPVQRGVWLMEQLLGRHLPNPPANVPQLSEDDKNPAGENIRLQLERHRADPSCASCHDRIDPLGVALENFDPIGRWRVADRDGAPLATVATTHDGVELAGAAGLRRYLAARQQEFFRHFTRKLLGYALGRAVMPGDQALLDAMQAGLAANGHAFSALVDAIVTSPQFTTRRAAPEKLAAR